MRSMMDKVLRLRLEDVTRDCHYAFEMDRELVHIADKMQAFLGENMKEFLLKNILPVAQLTAVLVVTPCGVFGREVVKHPHITGLALNPKIAEVMAHLDKTMVANTCLSSAANIIRFVDPEGNFLD